MGNFQLKFCYLNLCAGQKAIATSYTSLSPSLSLLLNLERTILKLYAVQPTQSFKHRGRDRTSSLFSFGRFLLVGNSSFGDNLHEIALVLS